MNFNITTPLTELIPSMSNTNKMIATNFNLENDSFSFEINGVNFLFRKIKSGEFIMGATDFRRDTLPPHQVKITRDFWMLETLVTQSQWFVLEGNSMASMLAESEFETFNGIGNDYPIYLITWYEAVEFCDKLTNILKEYGYIAKLPTEAEWEYACRGGLYLPYSFGDLLDGTQANCNGKFPYGQSKLGRWREQATLVKQFSPNSNGLYDMHGNMWEWCQDWYSEHYYSESPLCDPLGPEIGDKRVVRGGSWRSHAECCRSAFRDSDYPDYRGRTSGFRICLKKQSHE